MPEVYEILESTLDSQHNLGGTSFNLFKLSVQGESGFTSHGVELWRPIDKEPVLSGERVVAAIEQAGKDREKLRIDWRATNAMRQNGGGAQAAPAQAAAQPVRSDQNAQSSTTQGQQFQAQAQTSEASRQTSIERQSAMKIAADYARLMYDGTGEVPSIEQIKGWTAQLVA